MKLLLTLLLVMFSAASFALDVKEAIVKVNITDDTRDRCNLSAKSFESQLETVLRQNQIKIKAAGTGPYFHLTVAASEDFPNCFGHSVLQVYTLVGGVNLGWTNQKRVGIYEHCLRSFSFTRGKGFELQEKINSALADVTRQCISEVLKQ